MICQNLLIELYIISINVYFPCETWKAIYFHREMWNAFYFHRELWTVPPLIPPLNGPSKAWSFQLYNFCLSILTIKCWKSCLNLTYFQAAKYRSNSEELDRICKFCRELFSLSEHIYFVVIIRRRQLWVPSSLLTMDLCRPPALHEAWSASQQAQKMALQLAEGERRSLIKSTITF